MNKRYRQQQYFITTTVLLQILYLLCCNYGHQGGVTVSNAQTQSPSQGLMKYTTIVTYDQGECSSGQIPTNPPEKIVSFTPEECYRYPTRSILTRWNSPTSVQLQIFNTMTCQGMILTDMTIDTSIAGCQNPFGLPKWFIILFGKPQAPIIGSLPYLYYEKTSLSFFCYPGVDRYYSARTYLMPGRCTFSDYMGIAERGVDGTDTSIQTINDAVNCAGATTTYDYDCPAVINPYRIGLAFKTKPYTRVTGTVTVLSYTAIRVLGLDLGFDQKANAFTTVMLNQLSTSTPYKDGYSFQASTNMTFTSLTAGFSGTISFYVDGFDYVNNIEVAPLTTQPFTIPSYPTMTTITPVTVTTNSITITYGSTGGFVTNGNTYAVSATILPSTTLLFPQCSAITTCQLVGLPPGALVNVSVTVSNSGSSSTQFIMQQLVKPISNLDFAFQTAYSTGNITFSYSDTGYGETNFITSVMDQTTLANTTYNTKNMFQLFAVAPSIPTNYRVNVTALNDGNMLQVIKTFNWLGNILLSNITITDITSISANFWCNIDNLATGNYQIPITSATGSLVSIGISSKGPIKLSLTPNTQYTFSATVIEATTFRKSQTLPFVFSSVSTIQITAVETIQKMNALNQTYLQIRPTIQGGSPTIPTIFQSVSTNFTNGVTFNTSTNSFTAPNLAVPSGPFNLNIRASQLDDQVTSIFTFRIYKFPSVDQINVTSGYESANVSWTSSGGVPGTISYEVTIYNPSSTHPTPVSVCSGVATSCLITKLTSNTPYAVDIIVSSSQFDDYVKTSSIQTLRCISK
ncbi:hypothetical protein DFA_05166 [Cavenderia fasciculata]|uniref:Fibronectin type-III domain-containing protein n=1 Tax=Cavenderia fasciculata TaxID=261658 RepID=F4PNI3_CACFS|nr:uncharacterized protein DFA_05166 [Cavenderia fasciculata]EGG23036.1 hypothetical protein DFA_05166 [Cavenderia fasciculata]|eukprot:XP_004360887.1 hypothetical protein DFA_05166 [Cavenderia fasciculata]